MDTPINAPQQSINGAFQNRNKDALSLSQTPSNLLNSQKRLQNPNRLDQIGSQQNHDFNLFTHHKLSQQDRQLIENYETLKEALLELYLSVKIRSDDEIDAYTEDQFKVEKEQMREVDGFTLIDYIKSSIEILMNMKIEENELQQEQLKEEDEVSEQFNFDSKKLKQDKLFKKGFRRERTIPKIDDKTPTSSIIDLQKKLDQISSPTSSSSNSSIPAAHKEYEKCLRALENECRNHIKVEQQMKLHIECLQEKLDQITKERDDFQATNEASLGKHKQEIDKLSKIIKTLEEELMNKAEKIKQTENTLLKQIEDFNSQGFKLKELQKQYDKMKKENAKMSRNIQNIQVSQALENNNSQNIEYQDQSKQIGNVQRSNSEMGNYNNNGSIIKPINSSRESSLNKIPKLSVSVMDVQRDSVTERNSKASNQTSSQNNNNPYFIDSFNRLNKHALQSDAIKSMSNFNHPGNLSSGGGNGSSDITTRNSNNAMIDGHKRSKSQSQMGQLAKQINVISSKHHQININGQQITSDQNNQANFSSSFFKNNKNQLAVGVSNQRTSFSKIGIKQSFDRKPNLNSQLNSSRNDNDQSLFNNQLNSHRRNIQQQQQQQQQYSQSIQYNPFPSVSNLAPTNVQAQSFNGSSNAKNVLQSSYNNGQTPGGSGGGVQHHHTRHKTDIGLALNEMRNSMDFGNNKRNIGQQLASYNQVSANSGSYSGNQNTQQSNSFNNGGGGNSANNQNLNSQALLQYGNQIFPTDPMFQNAPNLIVNNTQNQSNYSSHPLLLEIVYFEIVGSQGVHARNKSNDVVVNTGSISNRDVQEKLSKIYLENNHKGKLKKVPKAYLQKVIADSRRPRVSDGGISQNIINTSFQQMQQKRPI
ncbi:UNKNOWN [Stylonychia lemnae]|uniref:Uncharacterized protein n=1 Tax=Stylonychia lemnae TaxID=5949 RepID=A0A077ZZZ2_STYLE|nr:UNKNOWN [Stylonychia lemnae]|eukprot:CDW75501.1 UNKNOWN [Stylonychia lemnae]